MAPKTVVEARGWLRCSRARGQCCTVLATMSRMLKSSYCDIVMAGPQRYCHKQRQWMRGEEYKRQARTKGVVISVAVGLWHRVAALCTMCEKREIPRKANRGGFCARNQIIIVFLKSER